MKCKVIKGLFIILNIIGWGIVFLFVYSYRIPIYIYDILEDVAMLYYLYSRIIAIVLICVNLILAGTKKISYLLAIILCITNLLYIYYGINFIHISFGA